MSRRGARGPRSSWGEGRRGRQAAEAPREVGVVGILRDAAERVDGGDDAEAGGVLVPLADDAIEPDGPDVAIVRTRGRTELPALLVVPPRRGLPHRS